MVGRDVGFSQLLKMLHIALRKFLMLMQSEYIYPDLADRSSPKEWEEQGKPVLVDEATAKVTAILAQGDNEVLGAEIDARLLARFELLLD